MIFYGYFGPHNYVSMKKRGTHSIAPKLRGAHFEGSIIPRGALRRLQSSVGQKLTENLPNRVLEPSKCALQKYGAFKVLEQCNVCPAFLWRHSCRGQNTHKNHLKIGFVLFFKVIFCKPLLFQRSIQPI